MVACFVNGKAYKGTLLTVIVGIDVLPSKNQALCEFYTHADQLKHY